MMVKAIDMDGGELDILVDGQLVLHIGQVSDDNVVDLFLEPQGDGGIEEQDKEYSGEPCTHRLIVKRRKE